VGTPGVLKGLSRHYHKHIDNVGGKGVKLKRVATERSLKFLGQNAGASDFVN